jgi:hypothetical protein
MISFLSFAVPLALYLAWPSAMWNFDGVACAAALELGWPIFLFHANHLLYGFLGCAFWKVAGLPFGMARALPALQLFTSLIAALGLVGLYRALQSVLKNNISAHLLTLGLAVTAAFWVWSVEAQVYALGFLPIAWATTILFKNEGENKFVWVGLLHAGAVLGHLMHVLWAVPALYWMWGKPKAIRQYLVTLFLATAIPYALVLAFVVAPRHDLFHILIWLKGSAGLTPDRSWAWHSAGWTGPWQWLKSTLPAFWGSFWPYENTLVKPVIWILTAVSMGLALLFLMRSASERGERAARFSWIWLGTYALFLSTWEPATLCYRMTDIVPLGILFALGLKKTRAPIQILLTTLFLGCTLTVNLASRILPMHDAGANKVYQETLSLSKISPSNSLYITQGGPSWIYLLYFTGRTAWNANAFPPGKLEEEIRRQKHTRPVYMQDGASWKKVP